MKTIALVVPAYNEQDVIDVFFDKVLEVVDPIKDYHFTILLVDDGSRDSTLEKVLAWRERDKRINVAALSRNFGHEAALAAGLKLAKGDAVIVMDADLQDPPELIPAMIREWEKGYDVVNAHRASRRDDTFLKRWTAGKFYQMINGLSSKVKIPENVGNFRLVSRAVVDLLVRMPEKNRVFRVLVPYLGFRTANVDYVRPRRAAGNTHYNYPGMIRLAIDGITSATTIPLQFAVRAGVFFSIAGFCYMLYIIIQAMVAKSTIAGWASTISVILFLGGVQLVFLGVIGTYIGRIFIEVKGRPDHVVERVWDDGE